MHVPDVSAYAQRNVNTQDQLAAVVNDVLDCYGWGIIVRIY